MDLSYDEDLSENIFFQTLRKDYNEIFLKATIEGCVLCVPRVGSLSKFLLTLDDILSHILVPSIELPESHFRTLSGKDVRLINQVLTVDHEVGHHSSIHVLFEETYYTEDSFKYKVLCIEKPLEVLSDSGHVENKFITLRTLRDCMDSLWLESGTTDVIDCIDETVNSFLSGNTTLESGTLQEIKDSVGQLYTQCIKMILKDRKLKEKVMSNKHIFDNLKLAVETYMHHGIYQKLMKGISTCTSFKDAKLNKIIRNLSDLQIKDLGVNSDLHYCIPKAKSELSKIDGYSTILGKVGCLKKMLLAVSQQPKNGNIVATDDLLPVMVFLVTKIGLGNWHAQIAFLKLFKFSQSSYNEFDEGSFLITSLEAAVEHIQSGTLLGSSLPEGQACEGNEIQITLEEMFSVPFSNTIQNHETMSKFFQQICLGNLDEVIKILDTSRNYELDYGKLDLCHPLCDCEKCKGQISKGMCDITPTVKSCDDRGLSALHIASMYGRVKVVDYLLMNGADPNVSDCVGLTPIHYTAMRGHQNALLLLAHAGADVNACDNSLNTPLHLCCYNGHAGVVKALIFFTEDKGIFLKINAQNVNGETPLHHAARWGYVEIIQCLLENHANPMTYNRKKLTPVDVAHNQNVVALLHSHQNTVHTMIRISTRSKSLDFTDDIPECSQSKQTHLQGVRPNSTELIKRVEKLLRAIACGDLNLACFYLSIDPNLLQPAGTNSELKETKDGDVLRKCHPLCDCSHCTTGEDDENDKVSKNNCLDVNMCNSEGITPLHIAAMHGHIDLARVLIHQGALLDVHTRVKLSTPLIFACQNQRIHMAKLLLRSGCNIDAIDHKGNTALHYACHTTNARLVELLVTFEPCKEIGNYENKTAMQVAEDKMALSILKILKNGTPFNLNMP